MHFITFHFCHAVWWVALLNIFYLFMLFKNKLALFMIYLSKIPTVSAIWTGCDQKNIEINLTWITATSILSIWQCQYLAMDTGGCLCVDSHHALITAWLDATIWCLIGHVCQESKVIWSVLSLRTVLYDLNQNNNLPYLQKHCRWENVKLRTA